HSPLYRDIAVKRIYDKNRSQLAHQNMVPLAVFQKNFRLSTMRPVQRSCPFQAHTTALLSNAQLDSF
ncbi:MAG: hypothetical protein FD143_3391, partial [Ignavibacteria bacterium]